MEEILISHFKEQCIALLKRAQRAGQGFIITVRGVPLARVEPIAASEETRKRVLGASRELLAWNGDIVQYDFSGDWEALR